MPEIKEPEEIKSEVGNAEAYNPLDEPVNEKSYSRPNVNIKAEDLSRPIPEPTFTPPPMDADLRDADEKPKPKPAEPVNPEFNNMSNKDKKASGDHMARMIMSGYEFICGGMNKMMLFNERKLKKLAANGEVDFSISIPYDLEGNTITAAEFIQDYNKQQDGALKVSDEFKEEMMPVLSRVLTKRGIGMTDEQYLIFGFGKDLVGKGLIVYNGIQTMNMMITTMKEMTEAYKSGGAQQTPPPPPNPQPNNPKPDPAPAPEPYHNEDDEIHEWVDESKGVDYTDALNHDVSERVKAQVEKDVEPKKGVVKISKPKTKEGRGRKGAPSKK